MICYLIERCFISFSFILIWKMDEKLNVAGFELASLGWSMRGAVSSPAIVKLYQVLLFHYLSQLKIAANY